ncbi:substrate-binding domain-containing protein [Shimia sagamensis]|uniref:Monosaccharide ABC transporter substrate-binding protein, CUT2 family n=1 Tax=Shimia sagamensis TaxID=1566352 RepID=A0ABY1N7D3_9RHOB|nr:substrate-binding domain-containing protein [Shimia sagamensis]SMP02356.1 monosaccharide ABC transporter substrate-binding protein, CUT2 family [Shimia sagamensis]
MTHFSKIFGAALAFSATLAYAEQPATVGPNGEAPTPVSNLSLSADETAKIAAGNHTAALVWHELYDWSNSVARGAKDEFARLGIEVVAETDANFDPSRQKSDVETVMAKDPSIIVSLPIDPPTAAGVYGIARDAGVKLVFVDNAVNGFTHGTDYVTVVSADLFQIGNKAAVALADAMGGKGEVGYMYHDADFPVTNQRDGAFKWTIENKYPDIKIVTESGMTDPANAEDIARGMLMRNPELDGIYTPWAEPALGVLSVLRQQGNTDAKVVTIDLNEPAALDMVGGGNIAAIVADEAYNIGVFAARAAAASLLDKPVEPFLVVDALTIGPDSVADGWMKSLHSEAPASLR